MRGSSVYRQEFTFTVYIVGLYYFADWNFLAFGFYNNCKIRKVYFMYRAKGITLFVKLIVKLSNNLYIIVGINH